MEQLKWETKKVKVKDLIQLDKNPRKISEDKKQKLAGSLEKFNLVEIPAVNTDLQIIGGNQRVTALLLVGRGEEEIDVRFPNRKLTQKEVKEYAIISNTHAGEFDFEILEFEYSDIDLGFLGVDMPSFAPDVDYSILDDDDVSSQLEEMTAGVKKAIQIEFEAEHYQEAYELVKFWREQGDVGYMILQYLKTEKEKL